ncbi:MAG TPA: DNA repair protein RadC [Rhodopila sp.]|uniref:RadC family protein n=1 Tax=Rhodopila sp. TaxID=2480087 RepID=UPI002B71CBAB|nr:DNA repair protein RadC [Rhodopila sp.]HVY16507.1 DNA repair protein RadC [Rhodopila sp.]
MPRSRKPPELADAPLFAFPSPAPDVVSFAGSEGHRGRLRQRLLTAGPDALADHEMLEMVLFIALPRRDTKPIARALLSRFGSFSAAVGAPVPELLRIEGLGEAGAAAIKLVQAAAQRLLKHKAGERPVLSSWDRIFDYLQAVMMHERVEQFRVLFLDNRHRLIADEVQGRGTIDRAPAYPREVVKRCLELNAASIVLAHNHPSGQTTPSRDDITTTREIAAAAAALGINLLDHIVVGQGKCLSFRQERLM